MYSSILKNPIFLKLSFVQLFVYFGSFFTSVAIYTMVLEFGATATESALVAVMFYLPAIFGVINGAVVDKFELKRFMQGILFAEMLFSSFLLAISEYSQIYILMVLIFFRALCSFLFFASSMALFPLITKDEEELQRVNELHSIIWSLTFAVGMSLGGVFVEYFGIYNTIKLDILLFVLALAVFWSIDIKLKKKESKSIKELIFEGYDYLKKNKKILSLIFLHSSVALTSFDTIVNLLTDSYYKSIIAISLSIGFLNGVRALGLMVGPFFISKHINRKNLHLLLIVQGSVIIVWSFFAKDFYLSLFFMFLIGFFTTTLWSYTFTLIQNATKKEYLGRVVAYSDMLFMSFTVAINFFTGYLFQRGISLEMITLFLGVGFWLFGFYYKKFLIQ